MFSSASKPLPRRNGLRVRLLRVAPSFPSHVLRSHRSTLDMADPLRELRTHLPHLGASRTDLHVRFPFHSFRRGSTGTQQCTFHRRALGRVCLFRLPFVVDRTFPLDVTPTKRSSRILSMEGQRSRFSSSRSGRKGIDGWGRDPHGIHIHPIDPSCGGEGSKSQHLPFAIGVPHRGRGEERTTPAIG